MMCERALSRESHGKVIAEHQMVQVKIADSYAAILFQPKFDADPQLLALAEAYKRFFANRH